MTVNEKHQALEVWRESSPIRKRRALKGIKSMSDVAALLNVSIAAVQFWETGAYEPRTANWQKLEELLGGGLREEWQAWFAARPQI